jgi:hypothetical protein
MKGNGAGTFRYTTHADVFVLSTLANGSDRSTSTQFAAIQAPMLATRSFLCLSGSPVYV